MSEQYGAGMPLSPDDELRSREDFLAFLRELHRDFEQRGHEWENATLDRFLEAMTAWVEGSEGWYRAFGKDMPVEGDWTYFARALAASVVYE